MNEKIIIFIIVLIISIVIFGVGYISGRIHEKSLRRDKWNNPYIK